MLQGTQATTLYPGVELPSSAYAQYHQQQMPSSYGDPLQQMPVVVPPSSTSSTLCAKKIAMDGKFRRLNSKDLSAQAAAAQAAAAAANAKTDADHQATNAKPPTQQRQSSSKYGFRFLKHERQVLETWYTEHQGRTAPISVRKEWVGVWNEHRRAQKQAHCEVSHQQVKQWFENMRRTRNHKSRQQQQAQMSHHHHQSQAAMMAAAGHYNPGAYAPPHPQQQPEVTMNPRMYLTASTGKMHQAISNAGAIVSKHIEQLQQMADSPIVLSPQSKSAMPSETEDNKVRWEAINLKAIVEKLLSILDTQIHSNPSVPSPRTTVSPQQEFHFQIFKQMLDIDRMIDPEWDALKELSAKMETNPNCDTKAVDDYMVKLEQVVTEKTKVMVSLIGNLPILPEPTASFGQNRGAKSAPCSLQEAEERMTRDMAWTRSWTIPPSKATGRRLDSKLCVFQGGFLNDQQRANFFLGVPVHASALASAVCFTLESGGSERLTSQEAQNLISLYEVAAVQELELSDQLDMLWNLKPASGMMPGANPEAPNSWRMWLQDHHNADIYCPLKVLAEAVPAVDQQYGFVSVTRNSLVLSLGFLKGLRYALPLPLFVKCMINFTQAHYLFAAAAMVEEVSSMVEDAPTGGQAPPILKEGGAMGLAEAAEAPPVKMEPGALDAEGPPPPQEEEPATDAAIVTVSMPDPKPAQAAAQEEGQGEPAVREEGPKDEE